MKTAEYFIMFIMLFAFAMFVIMMFMKKGKTRQQLNYILMGLIGLSFVGFVATLKDSPNENFLFDNHNRYIDYLESEVNRMEETLKKDMGHKYYEERFQFETYYKSNRNTQEMIQEVAKEREIAKAYGSDRETIAMLIYAEYISFVATENKIDEYNASQDREILKTINTSIQSIKSNIEELKQFNEEKFRITQSIE